MRVIKVVKGNDHVGDCVNGLLSVGTITHIVIAFDHFYHLIISIVIIMDLWCTWMGRSHHH